MQMGPRGAGGGFTGTPSGSKKEEASAPPPEELATVEYPEDEIRPEDIPF